jgi:DNA-binding Lrp family transcriptional regulator
MEEQKQFSYYMVLPAEVWSSEVLSNNAKLLFGHLQVLSQKEKYCFAGNKSLSKIMKVSENTIIEYLKELDENGFITRQLIYGENTKQVIERRIYINVGIITRPGNENNPQALVTKTRPGLVTKTTPVNTTSINNRTTTVVAPTYEFTTEKEQVKVQKEFTRTENNLNWNKLLSLWQTNEFAGTIKKTKKNYWDKLSTETHQSILQMVENLGSDKQYLQKIWISDCFENKKMNELELKKEIERIKKSSDVNKPGHGLINFNNL